MAKTFYERTQQNLKLRNEYVDEQNTAAELIAQLTKALAEHKAEFNNENWNWGYHGDLQHVNAELKEIVNFITGAE
jgi:acyl-homoserine lactone acylase PvdQ